MANDKNKDTIKSGFENLGIAISLINILEKLKLDEPTPIQKKSIPPAIEGKDLVGIAQTGTGKTFAYGIPMIQRLALHKGRGLVILPTRELALQVDENLKLLGNTLGLRTSVLIGGEPIGRQIHSLKRKPHILVATPGRLIDHLKRKLVNLDEVKILILDEADMMFDMGFQPQIEQIVAQVPKKRQTLLFSATMPESIMKLAAAHMSLPVRIEVAPAGTTAELVDQEMYIVHKEDKLVHLEKLLKEYDGSVLVFSRTKHGAKKLTHAIELMGYRAAEIHSNRSFGQRREALDGFKGGKYRVLVATDIAARGIDVKGIQLVVNFDLPSNSEDYVHRIGRTARAGDKGKAISLAMPSQIREIRAIERLIKKELPLTKFAELEKTISSSPFSRFAERNGRKRTANRQPGKPAGTEKSRAGWPRLHPDRPYRPKNSSYAGRFKESTSRAEPDQHVFRKRADSIEKPLQVPVSDKQRFRASMRKLKNR